MIESIHLSFKQNYVLNEFIYLAPDHCEVGNTVEYYAPESVVGDHFNICKGTVSTILPRYSLQQMTDVHVYVDGMIPITYERPI